MIKKFLKDKYILEKKLNLILKPNHFHLVSTGKKYWDSKERGTAINDGNGGYKELTK